MNKNRLKETEKLMVARKEKNGEMGENVKGNMVNNDVISLLGDRWYQT